MAFDLRLLGAFGKGLATGDSPAEQIANGLNSIGDARVAQGQRNKTLEFLSQSPEISQAVQDQLLTPQEGLKLYFAQQAETRKAQSPDNRYKAVGSRLFDLQTQDWISPPAGAGGDEELGLNLVYGQDTEGNTVGFQPSKSGGLRPVTLPPGVRLTPGTSAVDLGTSIGIRENRSGDIIRQVPKDVAGEAQQTAQGKAVGEANVALPGARSAADRVSQQVEALKNDPYLPSMVGPGNSRLPNITGDAARVQGKMDQLQGGAFLEARQLLKGGGAITDYEGQKAEAAFARLSAAQKIEDYKEALDDFNYWVKQGVTKLEQQAGRGGQQPAQGGAKRTATGVQWSID